jgi:hypothetical protein
MSNLYRKKERIRLYLYGRSQIYSPWGWLTKRASTQDWVHLNWQQYKLEAIILGDSLSQRTLYEKRQVEGKKALSRPRRRYWNQRIL